VIGVLACAAFSSAAFGQAGTGFTISDGDVFFTQANSPTSPTVTAVSGANFRVNGAAGIDHLFENWWWYRVSTDTREYALANAVGTVVGGNTATTTWNVANPAGAAPYNFRAELTYTATDTGTNVGEVRESMVITNTGNATIILSLFNYADFDVGGSAGTDSAVGGLGGMTITDGPWTAEFQGPGALNYQVTSFATLRGNLTNAVVNNLTNTGLPFGPGDFTGGFQWDLPLSPGQSMTVTERLAIVPAPASMALLGLGGLLAFRRRR
jgi:hypothetical protein